MSLNHLTAKFWCHRFDNYRFYNGLADQRGQGIIEYVLLVSVIAIAMIGSLISVKEIIYNVISNIPFPSS
jgi:Flp pilus assembly pilin Flp